MRPATVDDGRTVYDLLLAAGATALPTLDVFLEHQLEGVAARFLIRRRDTSEMVGFTELCDLEPAGRVRAVTCLPAGPVQELLDDAAALSSTSPFAMWRLRKAYLHSHVPSRNRLGFSNDHGDRHSGGAAAQPAYFEGRLWDVHVFAIYR